MHLRASAKNKLRCSLWRDMAWDIVNKICFRKGCFRLETHCELFYRCLFLYCGLWVIFFFFLQYHEWPLEHLYVWQFWKERIFENVLWRGYFFIVTAFFPTLMHFGQHGIFGANTSSGYLDKKTLCVLSTVFYYGNTSPLGVHNIKIHTHVSHKSHEWHWRLSCAGDTGKVKLVYQSARLGKNLSPLTIHSSFWFYYVMDWSPAINLTFCAFTMPC